MTSLPREGETFGRYQIIRLLGRGGMGAVYEARQTDLDRSVALKLLNPDLASDPSFRARFEREARVVANLDSTHVIQVYDAGELDGVLYIASQLVHGRDLMRYLRDVGPLTETPALRVVAQAAEALADAHDAGVLHRDVKPGNVLLRERGDELTAYLCDFGIARTGDSALTKTASTVGTLGYMAPELHEGHDASVASDVYSLGCLLWAALTGRAPYERTSEFQLAMAHLREPIPVYESSSPRAAAINAILEQAMAKDPRQRFASARQVAELCRALADGRQVFGDGSTVLRPFGGEDRTQLRRPATTTPMTIQAPPVEPRGRRAVIGWAVAGAVLLLLGVLAVFVATHLSGNQPANGGTGQSDQTSPAKPSVGAGSDASATVQCGDGSTADSISACPMPNDTGDLTSVFPSVDGACARANDLLDYYQETRPTLDCDYGDYHIRYSTWVPQVTRGRLQYFRGAYGDYAPDAQGANSRVRVWQADNTHQSRYRDAGRPWVWIATYLDQPYSVIVKSSTEQGRARGIAHVQMRP